MARKSLADMMEPMLQQQLPEDNAAEAAAPASQQQQQLRRPNAGPPQLSAQQLLSMYESVIKLTAENKLTKDNVWDLNFIDHMPDIIRQVRPQWCNTDAHA
jgi:hypothetical protein